MDRAPGQLAVADLAPAGRAHAARFAGRVRREVVVQHEGLAEFAFQRVDDLLVLAGAEGGNRQRLGLAAGEQRRAVGARQDADFSADRADGLAVAAVDALAGLHDVAAHDVALEILEQLADQVGLRLVLAADRFLGLLLHVVDLVGAGLLGLLGIGAAQIVGELLQLGPHRLLLRALFRQRPWLLGALLGEVDDGVDDVLIFGGAEIDGAQHHLFRQLLGLGFDHQHAFGGAGDDEVERRIGELVGGRVHHILAVDIADAGGADRTHERNAGDRQRRGRADQRDDIRIILQIVAQGGADDLRLVAVGGVEQRADRPVDQARCQHLLLGWAAFALEEAARDLAGGKGLFLVVHREREEIHARFRRFGADRGAQHHGVAIGGEHGAVGLTRDAAGLEGELPPAPHQFLAINLEHSLVLLGIHSHERPDLCRTRENNVIFFVVSGDVACVGPAVLGSIWRSGRFGASDP